MRPKRLAKPVKQASAHVLGNRGAHDSIRLTRLKLRTSSPWMVDSVPVTSRTKRHATLCGKAAARTLPLLPVCNATSTWSSSSSQSCAAFRLELGPGTWKAAVIYGSHLRKRAALIGHARVPKEHSPYPR